jgi:Arc/MetJ-type ribon-helix-helix transcriptional regulator
MNGKRIEARLPPELDARLEEWRLRHEFPPSRAESVCHAIERLLEFSDRAREEVGE